ncbi:MAG TPA: ABC transporter permease [Gemmatimonadaceae bacterium]|jgi:predicted permease
MTKRSSLSSRFRGVVRRRRVEAELAEELDFHLQMQARKHRQMGVGDDEALRLARLEFGNIELVKEDARDVRGARPIEDLFADVRYGWRGLWRAPVFSLCVVLTNGLGVGLITSVFTIFDAYVLRPFDIRDPYSLYSVQWLDRSGHVHDFTARNAVALRTSSAAIADVTGYRTFSARLNMVPVAGDAVTANYFGVTGVRAAIGRTLRADDDYAPVVILSHALWQRSFGSDSSIIGTSLPIRGASFRVVGVAQEGFAGFFKKPRDFWIPVGAMPRTDSTRSAADNPLSIIVRLRPGVASARAQAFITAVLQSTTASLPDSSRVLRALLMSRATPVASSRSALLAFAPLFVAFALVLALACANVASMLLARGMTRQRELGTRLALGATRARIVRQLVTECVVLAMPAVAQGFGMAWLVVRLGVVALFATLPPDLTAFVRLVPIHPDARVLVFAMVTSTASAFLFGVTPALEATRIAVVDAIRGNLGGQSPSRVRGRLVIAEVIVATLLLSIAGVLLREAARLGRMDTGLHTREVVSVEVQDRARLPVLGALRQSPSVDAISTAVSLPLDMRYSTAIAIAGDSTRVPMLYNRVSASYFDLLKIDLVGGRTFTPDEEQESSGTVIVSETAAHRLWPGASPVGRLVRLELPGPGDPLARTQNARVVGVVRDVVVNSLDEGRNRPIFYLPQSLEMSACCFLVRVRGNPVATKRNLEAELEKRLPGAVDRIDVLDTFVAGALYPYRVAYWVALGLGLLALGLTVIGVYGVVAYMVSHRARELGVRIALGATARDVLGLVLLQSVRQTAAGAAIGAAVALGVVQILSANIESMPRFDGIAFLGAIGAVLVACVAAVFLPARAALRVDPSIVLRQD